MAKRILVLMRLGISEMFVPLEKLQSYLDQGWMEISRSETAGTEPEAEPVATNTPKAVKAAEKPPSRAKKSG